jgi:hypothetical protein
MLKSGTVVEIFVLKIIANIRKEMKDTYMESATVSVQTNEQKEIKKRLKKCNLFKSFEMPKDIQYAFCDKKLLL